MSIDKDTLNDLLGEDYIQLLEAEKHYGDSWKKRGGIDSFMMLARKWDRIEHQVEKFDYNILHACRVDDRPEGLIDDIRDLRRYLLLVEHEIRQKSSAEEPGPGYVDQDGPAAPAVPRVVGPPKGPK